MALRLQPVRCMRVVWLQWEAVKHVCWSLMPLHLAVCQNLLQRALAASTPARATPVVKLSVTLLCWR
jgi:hypothetical protein